MTNIMDLVNDFASIRFGHLSRNMHIAANELAKFCFKFVVSDFLARLMTTHPHPPHTHAKAH